MPEPTPIRSRESGPIRIDTHAVENIRFIRETMERSAVFTSLSGWGAVAMGTTAVVAAPIASRQPNVETWLGVWLTAALVAAGAGAFTIARKNTQAEQRLARPAWNFIQSLFPSLLAGAVLTLVLYRAGQIDVIAGTWMLLYGSGIVTAGTVSVRVIPVMGLCFMGLGVASLFIPAAWADAMMAATFGGVHIVFGLIIVRKYGG